MIIIKTNKTDYIFKYSGNITIDLDDYLFLTITADSYVPDRDGLWVEFKSIIDKFWPQDIEYIRGNYDSK